MAASQVSRGRWAARLSRRSLAGVACTALAWGVHAQPIPYSELQRDTAPAAASSYRAYASTGSPLRDALSAARGGDVNRANLAASQLGDSLSRKLVTWTLIDSGARLAFADLDAARRDLEGWPHPNKRMAAVERALDGSGLSPSSTVAWFQGRDPETAEGAIALASALQNQGRSPEAQTLIRRWWRDKAFEADTQARMLGRFGAYLSQDDNIRRLDILLYGQQGPAARAMLDLVPADQRTLAETRMALRAGSGDAPQRVASLPASVANDPGLAFERARYLRKHSLEVMAVQLLHSASGAPPTPDAALASWPERRALMQAALRARDFDGAYQVADANGLAPQGADYAEAEFFAGWIALTKLHDPSRSEAHFANVQRAGQTPVTLSRALYWRGRAAEALGDASRAQAYWRDGGAYTTAFYGQLSAEKAGLRQLTLAGDPVPTGDDRARFEAREPVRAARLLAQAGERDLFRAFVLAIDDTLQTPGEFVLLVDLAKGAGDQDLAMRAARASGQKGFPLPERGWPLRAAPTGGGLPEAAFTLAITRQESNFDPGQRSGAGARGMMQLMPGTASILARRAGLSYSPGLLEDADYNMRLGATYLGQLSDQFSGSYVMAAAGYNAGPGRSTQWAGECGDPRQSSVDPADFLECIPFSETRNYVMRVMENVQVYRARLNGGSAPLTLSADLHRGGWSAGGVAGSGGYAGYDAGNTAR